MQEQVEYIDRFHQCAGKQHVQLLPQMRRGHEGCETEEYRDRYQEGQGNAIQPFHGLRPLQKGLKTTSLPKPFKGACDRGLLYRGNVSIRGPKREIRLVAASHGLVESAPKRRHTLHKRLHRPQFVNRILLYLQNFPYDMSLCFTLYPGAKPGICLNPLIP